jgi:hypothetical protein
VEKLGIPLPPWTAAAIEKGPLFVEDLAFQLHRIEEEKNQVTPDLGQKIWTPPPGISLNNGIKPTPTGITPTTTPTMYTTSTSTAPQRLLDQHHQRGRPRFGPAHTKFFLVTVRRREREGIRIVPTSYTSMLE